MKRKITYGLLTILLIGGLYVGLRLGFGFFTPYNSLTARQDITNGQVQIIAIGLPYMPQVRQRLAKQYGFEYNYVGCNATTELLNGSKYYNEVVEKYLTDKFGKDFWTKFNTRLDSIDNTTTRQITNDDIKGEWYLNKWTMFHTLKFSDTTLFVDNHIDSVFYSNYSFHNDTLILRDNNSNVTYKQRIIALTTDTLIIKSFGKKQDILSYSRTKREWTNE